MKNELEIIEELIATGQLEVEPLYYTITNNAVASSSQRREENENLKRGKVYRCLKTKQYTYFVDHNDCVYKPGDYVYVESNRCDQPYFVAGVQTFKMTKRGDQLNVVLNWFYRPCQLPETVYHTLVQDRRLEENFAIFFKDSLIQSREIFVSDVVNLLPVSSIRGKCIVRHFKDVLFRTISSTLTAASSASASSCIGGEEDEENDDNGESKKLLLIDDDTFFYIVGYNAEQKTLANIQGEIRVGSSYQARLPDYNSPKYADEYSQRSIEILQWTPDRMAESDLLMYISAARSITIAGVCNGGTTTNNNVDDDSNDDHGCLAAAQDQTTLNALISLHDNNYEPGRALQEFVKNSSTSLSIDKKWSDEETKKFVRGLKQYGKNFFKIRKDFLPHKETCHLVEFYYVWKKTEAANSQRPRQQRRRPPTNILRVKKVKTTSAKNNRPTSNDFVDFSSASENELDTDGGDNKVTSTYACHHCYSTTSKDWHHGGKDRALLCTDCRIYYKKYGELRQLERQRTPPSYLFKPIKECIDEGGIKTRRSNKDHQRKPLTPNTVDYRMDDATQSKSPGSLSTGSRSDEKSVRKGKKRKSEPTDDVDDEVSLAKHKAKYLSKDKLTSNDNSNGEFASSSSTSVDNESQDNSSMSSSPDESLPSRKLIDDDEQRKVVVKREIIAENVNKNVYNFVDDDAFAKSVAGFRRQLIELSQNDTKLLCPPMTSTSPTTATNPANIISSATLDLCKNGSVIKEIGKMIKDEPNDIGYGNEMNQHMSNVIKEPEPKIDDTEHHRSKTAIFRRHWYRGESNSCSRTDLVFAPMPDSAWAKKREQRMKNQADNKEKQIKQELPPVPKLQPTSRLNVPQHSPHQTGPNKSGSIAFIPSMTSSYVSSIPSSTPGPPSLTPVPSAAAKEQMPALQRLKEYAAMSGAHGTASMQQFFPGSTADPSLPNRILSGQYGSYEKEKLEFEIRERHKEKLQSQYFAQDLRSSIPPGNFPFFQMGPNMGFPAGVDPRQWMAAQQSGHFVPPNSSASGLPPLIQTANLDPVIVERLLATLSAERVHLERLLALNPNPMLRLELDKVTAQLAAVAGTQHHTHSHTHSHTHLHIHPTTGVPMLNDEIADLRSWPPHPALVNQEMLLHQYASMFRANPNMDPNLIGLPQFGPQFGLGPQVGLEHLAAERLQQLQQQEIHRRMMMEREHMIAAQHQSIVQHNEMMRRLHDEGNYGGSSSSRPSASIVANEMSLPPFDKR